MTSDEFVSDGWGVCANATALSSNAAARLNDEIVFMGTPECKCGQVMGGVLVHGTRYPPLHRAVPYAPAFATPVHRPSGAQRPLTSIASRPPAPAGLSRLIRIRGHKARIANSESDEADHLQSSPT